MIELLMSLRFLIGFSLISYGAYTDIKTRTASPILWQILLLVGVYLIFMEALVFSLDLFALLLYIICGIPFVYLLWRTGLFGGADAKCFISLAFLIPFNMIDVLLTSCLICILSVPVVHRIWFKDKNLYYVITQYQYPFLLYVLFSFSTIFILSDYFSINLMSFIM